MAIDALGVLLARSHPDLAGVPCHPTDVRGAGGRRRDGT